MMDEIQKRLLAEVADLHGVPEGAYNIRANGQMAARNTTANIDIVSKTDVSGIEMCIRDSCEVFAAHKEEIQSEVLAVDIKEGALEGYQKEWNINGHKVELGVEKQ